MKISLLRPTRLAILAALCAAVFIFVTLTRAADSGFPIYFENAKLIVKPEIVNRTTYLPLVEIIQFLKLPYTDAVSLETFTIRNGNSRLVLTRNSGLISVNDQITILRSPILRENDRWLVPVDFFTQGLTRIAGMEFRYRAGAPRMFVGNVQAPQLEMNAQSLGSITRLTIRIGAQNSLSLNRADPKRTVVLISKGPLDPVRETLDHRDKLVGSIAYDDADGEAKIVVDTTDEVADVHVTPAEGNQIFFVDFSRTAPTAQPEPVPEPAAAAKSDAVAPILQSKLRVVVLDPGHGGLDIGTTAPGLQEKDLTMIIARKLRIALQTRLGVTVLLTRDADVEMDNGARSAVANNNQANLFISLHIGYSPNKLDSGSSVFVMKNDFGSGPMTTPGGHELLFLPWYMGYRTSIDASTQAATFLQEELTKSIPGWKFPLRHAPLGVLSSATMPAMVLEIGNLNNGLNAQTLVDANFQNKLVTTIVGAVQRFAETQPTVR